MEWNWGGATKRTTWILFTMYLPHWTTINHSVKYTDFAFPLGSEEEQLNNQEVAVYSIQLNGQPVATEWRKELCQVGRKVLFAPEQMTNNQQTASSVKWTCLWTGNSIENWIGLPTDVELSFWVDFQLFLFGWLNRKIMVYFNIIIFRNNNLSLSKYYIDKWQISSNAKHNLSLIWTLDLHFVVS